METRKAEEKDLPAICRMASARMVDSVEASYLLENVSNKIELANQYITVQLTHRYHTGEVWVIGDCRGILAGYYGEKVTMIAELRMSLKLLYSLRKHLAKSDTKRLRANLRRMDGAQNFQWRKQVCGSSEYYCIDLIVIDKELKGSGAFRALITPIIQRAERENMPVLLDTHDKDNVPIYQSFGFELAGEHHARYDTSIVQYSLIKRP